MAPRSALIAAIRNARLMTLSPSTPIPEGAASISEAILGVGSDGIILFADPGVEQILGYSPSDVMGAPIDAVVVGNLERTSTDDESPALGVRRTETGGSARRVTGRHRNGADVEMLANVSFAPRPNETGVIVVRLQLADGRPAEAEQIAQHVDRDALLARFGAKAIGNARLSELYEDAIAHIRSVLAVDCAAIVEYTAIPHVALYRAGAGWRQPPLPGADIELDPSLGAADADHPVAIPDLDAAGQIAPPDLLADRGVIAYLSVAIAGARGAHGSLIACATSRRRFDASELAFAQSIANTLSAALLRHRTEQALRTEAEERAVFGRISRAISDAASFDDVFDISATELALLVDYEVISVRLIEQDRDAVTLSHVAGPMSRVCQMFVVWRFGCSLV